MLFRRAAESGLDVVASRTEQTLYLHVVNTNPHRSVAAQLNLADGEAQSSRAFTIADDPMVEVSELNSDSVMQVAERELPLRGAWEFPAASVTAVEVKLAA